MTQMTQNILAGDDGPPDSGHAPGLLLGSVSWQVAGHACRRVVDNRLYTIKAVMVATAGDLP